VSERVSHEELMRYLDGEVGPEERTRIEQALEASTEVRRELAVYRAMKDDLQALKLQDGGPNESVWHAVNRSLARPLGWVLLVIGSLVWAAYGSAVVVTGFVARFKPLRILGIGLLGLTVLKVFVMDMQALDKGYRIAAFVAVGVLLLAVSLLYQRQRREAGVKTGPDPDPHGGPGKA